MTTALLKQDKQSSWIGLTVVVSLLATTGFMLAIEVLFESGIAQFIAAGNTNYDATNIILDKLYGLSISKWVSIQVVTNAFTAVVIGLITFELVGKYHFQGAILAALTPTIFLWTNGQNGETPLLFFGSLGVYFILRYLKVPGWKYGMLSGLCLGLALLTRGTLVAFPFIGTLTLFGIFVLSRNFSIVRASGAAVLPFILCFVIVGLPVAKNYQSTGYVFWSAEGGKHLLDWVYPCLTNKYGCGIRDLDLVARGKREYAEAKAALPSDMQENVGAQHRLRNQMAQKRIADLDVLPLAGAIVAAYIKQLTYTSLRTVFARMEWPQGSALNYYVRPNPKYQYNVLAMVAITMIECINVLLRLVQSIGLVSLLRNRAKLESGILVFAYFIAAIASGIGIGHPRYRSATEVVLVPLTILGLVAIKQFMDSRTAKT